MHRVELAYNEVDSNEDVIYSRDPKIVNYSWTKEATRLLITIRSQLDPEFDDPNQRKMDLWEKISITLKENGFDFPPSICDKKWRNLLVSFRRTISRGTQGKLGRFPYTWEFYEDLLGYWQKKDPVGVRNLSISSSQNNNSDGVQEDDNSAPVEQDFEDYQDDGNGVVGGYEMEDHADGDLNKFLTVTMSESDEEPIQDDFNTNVRRRGEIEIRPHSNLQQQRAENLEISALAYSPNLRRGGGDSPPLPSQRRQVAATVAASDIKLSSSSRLNKFRPTPTITIEEIRPGKRRAEEDLTIDSNSIQAIGLNNPQLNISLRERSENNQDYDNCGIPIKTQRRNERDGNDSQSVPAWLHFLKSMEDNAQKRWEITEARQIREYKQKRDLDLQLIAAIQNLSTVLVKITDQG